MPVPLRHASCSRWRADMQYNANRLTPWSARPVIDVDRHVEAMIDAAPEAVVAAYRRKFAIAAATPVTAAMIRQHWRPERHGAPPLPGAPPRAPAAGPRRAPTPG